MELVKMRPNQILMRLRAWWFLRIARNTTPPFDVKDYSLKRIEQQRLDVICKGAAAGKTISTEAALKHVLELKTKYEGPNRAAYVSEIDCFANDFRQKHGPLIPVDQAYAIFKELEVRLGRIE